MEIIIKGKVKIGRVRSEHEENMRKEWGGTITDVQLDKLKYIEKKLREETGSKNNFVPAHLIDEVK